MDLNGDGFNDILSGSYSRMDREMAGLFQVLWGQSGGAFKKPAVLNGTDGEPLIIPIANREQQIENICTRPTAIDWDGDSDLDLVVGNFSGTFYVFSGEGSGNFNPKPEPILANGEPLRIEGVHSDPFVIDWDNDGDLDLLSGSSNGGVYLAVNEGEAGQPPVLKAFEVLIQPTTPGGYGQRDEEELTGPTTATRIWIDDVNGDGKLDVLAGDRATLVSPAEGLSAEEFKQKLEQWQKDVQETATAINDTKADQKQRQKAVERYSQLHEERNKFMKEDMTGFVWLYVQK